MNQENNIISPATALDELVQRAPSEPIVHTAAHKLRVLHGMESMLGTMLRDLEQTQRRALFETYIYRDDRLGRALADALARTAARGVDTRVLYDPLGSQETDPAFFDEMRARGINVRAYRPKETLLAGANPFPRDHTRVIVIDDHGYTGGAAWGDEWLPIQLGGHGWHDVCMQVDGPAVQSFVHLFEQRWREATGEIGVPRDLEAIYPDLEFVADAPEGADLVYDRYVQAIENARGRVWLANAYFFPPTSMLKALYDAAVRGVDVQVILTGDSDLEIVGNAARAEYATWLERGLKIFEYKGTIFHAKYAVVDDDLCTIGTMNANPTSMRLANELNIFVRDPAFVRRVALVFQADRARSVPVTPETVAARPLIQQVVDRIANDTLNLVDVLVGPPSRT
jgi:cardiolipin synthase